MAERGPILVEVDLRRAPDGDLAVLLQLPDGYVLIPNPEEARDLALKIHEAANALEALKE